MCSGWSADMHELRQARAAADWRQARALLLDYVEWVRAASGLDPLVEQAGFAAELEDLESHFGGADAALFVAYAEDVAVGTAALRRHRDGTAELKRMYVRPVARGCGLAAALLRRVLREAAERGCRVAWLESLRGVMDPAIALYARHGFVEVADARRSAGVESLVVMRRVLVSEVPSA